MNNRLMKILLFIAKTFAVMVFLVLAVLLFLLITRMVIT